MIHDQTGSDDNQIKTHLNRVTSVIEDSDRLERDEEQSMPQFIQEMYRNPNMAYNFKKFHHTADKSSMSRIICIPHIETSSNIDSDKDQLLRFKLTNDLTKDEVMGMDLRLLVDDPMIESSVDNNTYQVSVYQTIGNHDIFVSQLQVSRRPIGWITFQLHNLVLQQSINNQSGPLELKLAVRNQANDVIPSSKIGILISKKSPAFLLAYVKSMSQPFARPLYSHIKKHLRAKKSIVSKLKKRRCHLVVDTINLKTIYGRTILAPQNFEYNFCVGRCKFPLTGHMNATNHAIVQTLMYVKKVANVPRACCTPDSFSTLRVISRDEKDSTFEMQLMKDIVAETCSCR